MTEQIIEYRVLVNDEEQYAIFPALLDVPAGWQSADFEGTRDDCVKFVDEHWSDMRPRSLRERMARNGQ